jgi:hypothetical protein
MLSKTHQLKLADGFIVISGDGQKDHAPKDYHESINGIPE